MEKHVIFFSHSSRDRTPLARLKELFQQKTGGSFEVFLSSDGESIAFGRNWVHRVEEALDKAKLMFIFITPQSAGSSWIHFEAGFAYSRSIEVVPVCLFGMDLRALPPPLSLLQGFNVASVDQLDNLIAVVNRKFETQHAGRFSLEEFRELNSLATSKSGAIGKASGLVSSLQLTASAEANGVEAVEASTLLAIEALTRNKIQFHRADKQIYFHGVTLSFGPYVTNASRFQLSALIDPLVAHSVIPTINDVLTAISEGCLAKATLTFNFKGSVDGVERAHEVSARLLGTQVEIFGSTYHFEGYEFVINIPRGEEVYVEFKAIEPGFHVDSLFRILNLLFEQGVLWSAENFVYH